jgi:hypothetical protein
MGLKPAIFEMKEAILNQQIEMENQFIEQLEKQNKLYQGSLVNYFNTLMLLKMNNTEFQKQSSDDMKKTNRKWTKLEIDMMLQYIKERQAEGAQNITEILEEVGQLLNRGYQSVNYKYYTVAKDKNKKKEINPISDETPYQFMTIDQNHVPILSAEEISETPQVPFESNEEDNLLDILSGLITNVQQLPGINLNELLKSLYLLTNMALQNKNVDLEIKNIKTEMNQTKDKLVTQLKMKDQQLQFEKQRNDELQKEVAKLATEITAYNQLGDAAKVQNLKSYNQRLKYIVDGFGGVLQVGS